MADAPRRPRVVAAAVQLRAIVLITVVAAVVYSLVLAASDVRAVARQVASFPWWMVPAVLGLVTGGYALRGLRWHVYMRRAHLSISTPTSILTCASGFAMGVTPGKVGEFGKTYIANKYGDAPYRVSIAAVVAERATDVAGIALLIGASVAALPGVGLGAAFALLVVVGAGIAFAGNPRFVEASLSVAERVPGVRRVVRPLRSVHGELHPLLRGRVVIVGVLVGIVAWGLEVLAMYTLAAGLGIPLGIAACTLVFSVASIAGALSMLPGGLGVTEGGMVALLLIFDVPLGAASALTIAIRLATLWFGVLVGVLAWTSLASRRWPVLQLAAPHATRPDGGPKSR